MIIFYLSTTIITMTSFSVKVNYIAHTYTHHVSRLMNQNNIYKLFDVIRRFNKQIVKVVAYMSKYDVNDQVSCDTLICIINDYIDNIKIIYNTMEQAMPYQNITKRYYEKLTAMI